MPVPPPAALRPLIDSCLAKEPDQRATVQGLLSTLAAEESGPPGARQTPARPTGAPDPRTPAPRTPAPRTPAPSLGEAAPIPPLDEAAQVADHPVPPADEPATERPDKDPDEDPAEDPADRTSAPVPPHPATAPGKAAPAAPAPRPLRRKVLVATAAVVAVGAAIGFSGRDRGEGGSAAPTGGAGTADPTPAAVSCPRTGSRFATSGSGLQAEIFQHWTQGYATSCPGNEVSFTPTGSGQGVREFAEGTTELAVTDGTLRPQERAASATRCAGGSGGKEGKAVQLPLATMPVSVIYHLSGVDSLVLDAKTLAGIYRGEISKWNDSRIAALNPGAKLPATAVKPLFKSLASGTNLTFTQYLAKAAAYDWPEAPDTEMAAEAGIGKQTSKELAEEVAGTEGSLSYVERGQEGKAAKAALDTGAADPVALTPESAARTVAAGRVTGEGADLAVEIDHGTSAPGAYPLVQLGYALVCDQGNAPGTLPSLRSFLAYTTGREAQSATAGLGFGPLPPELADQVRKRARDLG
ncbi:substrate-binding domain-containing protein [Streptomyces physcomitrii]|uniref:substrate-binding domain-containing protein n=1 Tax=Streptomyces physcomitrii TaxID=2724184 RepID=UPI003444AD99